MRHRYNKIVLNKSKAHTRALVRSLITSLVKYGQIKTTAPKAKILRKEIEKLISRSKKRQQVHAIREANKVFFENDVTKKFFDEYLPNVKDHQSGYTKTYKIGNRLGDDASMVLIKLTHFEAKAEAPAEAKPKAAKEKGKKENKAAEAAAK